ncbi:hypothetical protein SK128_018714 [Halocaridina rubra]|uniref:Uncharacterized protein n=1 Tax=Halocaridina rubra TaxID=373956 RepID=A0AAN8XTH3_HALRR
MSGKSRTESQIALGSASSKSQLSIVDVDSLALSAEALLKELGSTTSVRPFSASDDRSRKPSNNTIVERAKTAHPIRTREPLAPNEVPCEDSQDEDFSESQEPQLNSEDDTSKLSVGQMSPEPDLSNEEMENEMARLVPPDEDTDNVSSSLDPPSEDTENETTLLLPSSEVNENAVSLLVPLLSERPVSAGLAENSRRSSLPDEILSTTGIRSRSMSEDDLHRPISTLGDLRPTDEIMRSLPVLYGGLSKNARRSTSKVGDHRHFHRNGFAHSLRNRLRHRRSWYLII